MQVGRIQFSSLKDLQEILALIFKRGGEVISSLVLCSKLHLLFQV